MNTIKAAYHNGECPDCGDEIPDDVQEGQACANCEHVFGEERPNNEPDESMDGDAASAGFGTDEDYEHGSSGAEDF